MRSGRSAVALVAGLLHVLDVPSKAPAIDLSRKRRVTPVSEEQWYNCFFEVSNSDYSPLQTNTRSRKQKQVSEAGKGMSCTSQPGHDGNTGLSRFWAYADGVNGNIPLFRGGAFPKIRKRDHVSVAKTSVLHCRKLQFQTYQQIISWNSGVARMLYSLVTKFTDPRDGSLPFLGRFELEESRSSLSGGGIASLE
jgi:hypothetical protein